MVQTQETKTGSAPTLSVEAMKVGKYKENKRKMKVIHESAELELKWANAGLGYSLPYGRIGRARPSFTKTKWWREEVLGI